jgi:hypothetical protein
MRPAAVASVVALWLGVVVVACHEGGEASPCEGVDCSGHGTCFDDGARAQCDCFPGYRSEALECVPDGSDGDADADDDQDGDRDSDSGPDGDAETPDPCSSHATCESCIEAGECGWCDDTAHCTAGDYAGPADGSCDWLDWDWAGCD